MTQLLRRQVQLEAQILEAVAGMLSELDGGAARVRVGLDSHLERDLGIYSLERVALFLRLEEVCGVRIPEEAMLRVEHVADLVNAVTGQPGAGTLAAAYAPQPEAAGGYADNRSAMFSAYAALLVAAIAVPVWVVAGLLRRHAAAGLMRRAARLLVRASGLPLTVTGLAHVAKAPAVLVANHQSYLDSIILLGVLPHDVNVAVNEKVAGSPVLGRFVRAAGYLVVDRTSTRSRVQCAARMTDSVRRGESVLVFPEGTFPLTPPLLPFRLGPFAAAADTGRAVIPIAIDGTREVLPWGTWRLRRSAIHVVVHSPLPPREEGWREAVRLRAEARRLLARSLAGAGPAGRSVM